MCTQFWYTRYSTRELERERVTERALYYMLEWLIDSVLCATIGLAICRN